MHRYGMERVGAKPSHLGRRVFMRMTNDRHILTLHTSADGKTWQRYPIRMEVSGYHHNVMYDFPKPAPGDLRRGVGIRAVQERQVPRAAVGDPTDLI